MKIDKHLSNRTHEVEWSGIRIMFALADEIPDVSILVSANLILIHLNSSEMPPNRPWTTGIPAIRRQKVLKI